MKLVKIEQLANGGHDNMTYTYKVSVPDGWAVIPEGMETPNFPFGNIKVAEVEGVMTVIKWEACDMPEPTPEVDEEPTADEILNALLGVSV